MTVLPGLWDMHVHTLYAGHPNIQYWHRTYTPRFAADIMPAAAVQLLMAGVTSARDMGAPPDAIFGVAARIARGEIPGPTLYPAGPQLTHEPPDWALFYRRGVSGPADAGSKARQLLDAGAKLLKITDAESMTVDEIRAIVREARLRGAKVAAHGRTEAEIRIGLDGGVDEFEHIGVGDTGSEYSPALIEAIRARVAAGPPLFWTPTVGLPLNADALRDNPESLDDPAAYRGLPESIAADVRKALAAFRPQGAPTTAAIIRRKVAQLREAGVTLLVGTDAGLAGAPHGASMAQELEAWVSVLGIDAATVIRTATATAAAAVGAAESGAVTAGKYEVC